MTKIALLLIAAALWINLLKPLFPVNAHAGRENIVKVDIYSVGGRMISAYRVPVDGVR